MAILTKKKNVSRTKTKSNSRTRKNLNKNRQNNLMTMKKMKGGSSGQAPPKSKSKPNYKTAKAAMKTGFELAKVKGYNVNKILGLDEVSLRKVKNKGQTPIQKSAAYEAYISDKINEYGASQNPKSPLSTFRTFGRGPMALPPGVPGVSNPYVVSVPNKSANINPAFIKQGYAVPYNTEHRITPIDSASVTATTGNGTKFIIPLNTSKNVTSVQSAPTVPPKKGTIVYDSSLGSSKSQESLYSVIPPAPKPVYATVLGTQAERKVAKAAAAAAAAAATAAPKVPPKLLARVAQSPPREIEESEF